MNEEKPASHFIQEAISEDLKKGRYYQVHTRFPPEPNGYLHIGHVKALSIVFGMAQVFGGKCNLRFDDTNPVKEDVEYVDMIKDDIHWLGFDWEDREFYASDYFGKLYEWAVQLIKSSDAYVDDLSPEEIRDYRGTLTEHGKESPYRNRSVEENLNLFQRMRAGEFPDGARVLRAKIDMSSGNMNLRDPVMYRILHTDHHRTGNKWCIYPMYDYAHGQSDSIEGITHSLCDIAYEDHRPLYEWFLDKLNIFHPRQLEFARLNVTYTLLSKRFLKQLVEKNYVKGWDDPRMPTISGMRRRGYPAATINDFIERVGVAKNESIVDISLLEHCVRENLNKSAQRVMGVLDPLKVIITNYPEGKTEYLEAVNNPEDLGCGSRQIPFSREIYIERGDFKEDPPPKYFRLAPEKEVRLRYGYFIRCQEVIKDEKGHIVEVHCTYDPKTRGGYSPDGRKVQGTLHWVSVPHALEGEIRVYDRLFNRPDPGNIAENEKFLDFINSDSLKVIKGCKLEPALGDGKPGDKFQFERLGYYCMDPDSLAGTPIFNLIVELRDPYTKVEQAHKKQAG